uniref:Arf-GAP with dual PH domain-containing protein 2 n=1 Tax=Oryzias sinensis TaxID=183150 RepID=A0A8C7WNG6_9TELE
MANLARNNKILLELVQRPGNNLCADCSAPEPDWASYTLGVFVCLNCSGMHRNLPTVSKVKSIRLDYWDSSLVEFMQKRGNSEAKAIFEKCVPTFFYKPRQNDCIVLKDQWIRAKYERREFTGENNKFLQIYTSEQFESPLWKKGRVNKQFLKRNFLLSQRDFTLKYFIKEDSKVPKAVISMKDLNADFQPEKIGHPHGLQISYSEDDHTRNLFVYHDDGTIIASTVLFKNQCQTILNCIPWLYKRCFSTQLVPQLTSKSLKEGYMEKTGPTTRESFKKRWFTLNLTNRKLLYLKSPLEATEKGFAFIGSESHGYSVSACSGQSKRGGRWRWGIFLKTPDREYVFMCEQESEQKEWIEAFRKIISQPMTPEDYASTLLLCQITFYHFVHVQAFTSHSFFFHR